MRKGFGCLCALVALVVFGCPGARGDEITVKGVNGRVRIVSTNQKQMGLFGRWQQNREERRKAEAEAKKPVIVAVPEGSKLLGVAPPSPALTVLPPIPEK